MAPRPDPLTGEMVQGRMAWDSPWQNYMREQMDRNWRGFYNQPQMPPIPPSQQLMMSPWDII